MVQTRELYGSANGDRWSLARDPASGRVFVRHEPNASSGGRASDIEVGAFLSRDARGSEHQELLRLIGTLVEDASVVMTTSTGTGPVATDETDRLIASNKVEGTAVYDRQGERRGSVHHLMLDKRSGQVAYAVMSFGGFLGMGEHYHPLPWKALSYDTSKGGYVVDLDKETLKAGPSYTASASPTWDRSYSERIDRHYGVSPYWGDTSGG
jgi:hypothetical protein